MALKINSRTVFSFQVSHYPSIGSEWYKLINGVETKIYYMGKIMHRPSFSLKPFDESNDVNIIIFSTGFIYRYGK